MSEQETPVETLPDTPFKEGDKVKLHQDYYDVSRSHNKMIGIVYTVKKCYYASLGNLIAAVIYLEKKPGVKNPYLAEYFELANDES